MTVNYDQYMKSPQWKKKRKLVMIFFDHKCAICNKSGRLEAHHRTYQRLGAELLTDLIPLCPGCHETFHNTNRLPGQPKYNATTHEDKNGHSN